MFQKHVLPNMLKASAKRAPAVMVMALLLLPLPSPVAAQLPAPPVVGTSPFQVGGYAALTLTHAEQGEKTELPEVSELLAAILAWGQISPRASYLVELDLAKRTTETWTGRESDSWLLPVRVYLEYTASDLFRLRAGRFLTPVGQWNERHAEPLTWTPTRPLTTYRPFAKSMNGFMAAGSGSLGSRDVGYAVFWSPTGSTQEDEENSFVQAAGGRLAMEVRPGLTVGLSGIRMKRSEPEEWEENEDLGYLSALQPVATHDVEGMDGEDKEGREEDVESRTLLGADLRWVGSRFQLTAEGSWLPDTEHGGAEGGGFLQGAVNLGSQIWAVARGEGYRLPGEEDVQVGYAGFTWRYHPRLVAKFGWQFVDRPSPRIPDGWFFSISSLF